MVSLDEAVELVGREHGVDAGLVHLAADERSELVFTRGAAPEVEGELPEEAEAVDLDGVVAGAFGVGRGLRGGDGGEGEDERPKAGG